MSNILVTGSNGQLCSEIQELATNPEHTFIFTDRTSLDIIDEIALRASIETNNINTIINCAAYTAVDKAESDMEMADKINHQAVKYLAEFQKKKI
jgi:dTDP-4-dehydrorhamnose reductase